MCDPIFSSIVLQKLRCLYTFKFFFQFNKLTHCLPDARVLVFPAPTTAYRSREFSRFVHTLFPIHLLATSLVSRCVFSSLPVEECSNIVPK
ncbi:hypothetical protein C0J52_25898 [Blattella germanica]|nr:hypothetical protein C0J52_25898 [Blattella germanica]